MNMKTSRKVISIMIAVVIAFATVCMVSSATLGFSLASKSFFSAHLINDQIVEECNNQLSLQYDALEAESGIPARVFEMVTQDYSTEENIKLAASYIFSEETSELYSPERVSYFYNLCVEYLEGNSIEYNKADIEMTADKAAKIYSNAVGIHNTEAISQYLVLFERNCTKASSISIVAIIICVGLLVLLYRKKNDAFSYFATGITGGGIATILGALLALIAQVGTRININPAVYQASITSMIRIYFGYLILAGVLFTIIGGVINFLIYKNYKNED